MSDWADEEARKIIECWHIWLDDDIRNSVPSRGLERPIATALRAAERKGLLAAKEAVSDELTYASCVCERRATAAIQSLIDKPETEERR